MGDLGTACAVALHDLALRRGCPERSGDWVRRRVMVALEPRLFEGEGATLKVFVGGAGELTVCRTHPAPSAEGGLARAAEQSPSPRGRPKGDGLPAASPVRLPRYRATTVMCSVALGRPR